MEIGKKVAAMRAAELIEKGMIVGLGTGSTAFYFIQALSEKKNTITTVSSSLASADLAKKFGLTVLDLNDVSHIDLTVDGADQVDHQRQMIKGGGGALTREKILASSSKKMIVIVDESKVSQTLGDVKLPVEIVPYGCFKTLKKMEALNLNGSWRLLGFNRDLFVTENGNYIFDIEINAPLLNPEQLHFDLLAIPGVIETGLFLNLATEVFVGKEDKSVFTL